MQFMHAQFLANALIFHADPLNRKLLLNIKSCSSKTFKHITKQRLFKRLFICNTGFI